MDNPLNGSLALPRPKDKEKERTYVEHKSENLISCKSGRRRSSVALWHCRRTEQHGQTALKAFDDVEVTITNERYLKDEQKDATDALKSTEDALNLAVVKYNIGQTHLSPVLQLENVVSATQMANTYVQNELLANRINLYLALGGAF